MSLLLTQMWMQDYIFIFPNHVKIINQVAPVINTDDDSLTPVSGQTPISGQHAISGTNETRNVRKASNLDPARPTWTVLIYFDNDRFQMVNNQYLTLIKHQKYKVDVEFIYFQSKSDPNNIIVLDDLVQKYVKSELIFVQNEHDFVLYDTLLTTRETFINSDITKSSGLFCIKDDLGDKKRLKQKHEGSPYQIEVNYTKFEAYKKLSLLYNFQVHSIRS